MKYSAQSLCMISGCCQRGWKMQSISLEIKDGSNKCSSQFYVCKLHILAGYYIVFSSEKPKLATLKISAYYTRAL